MNTIAPALLCAAEVAKYLNSERLYQRARRAGWLTPLLGGGPTGGRSLFLRTDVEGVIQRMVGGERLPLLLCELKPRVRSPRKEGGKRKGKFRGKIASLVPLSPLVVPTANDTTSTGEAK